MSFPRYEKVKDSGVEWLGQIPRHWATKRLRFVAEINPSKSEVSHLAADTEVSFLPMEAIGEDGALDLDRVRPLADVQTGYTFFRDGDVAIAKITPCFENGKGAAMRDLCNGIGFGTTELIVLRPKATETSSNYLHWLFNSRPFRKAGESFMYGAGGQKRVPDDFVRDFAIGFPPLAEQRDLADFLDRETTKIDALVEEQKRLIDLLKEKRQAVISRAVTKGLNPNAPMKDSGVEWLGEVPAHWAVAAVAYRYEVLLGKMLDEKRITGNHLAPYLRNVDVQWDRINIDDLPLMDFAGDDLERYGLVAGDLLVCEGGDVGRAAIWRADLTDCFYQKALHRLRRRDNNADISRFMLYVLRMAATCGLFIASEGRSTIAHLTAEALRRYRFAFPSPDEQSAIVTFLDEETVKIDELIAAGESAMSLLAERRTALISAAVTGKIDVRGVAATRSSTVEAVPCTMV